MVWQLVLRGIRVAEHHRGLQEHPSRNLHVRVRLYLPAPSSLERSPGLVLCPSLRCLFRWYGIQLLPNAGWLRNGHIFCRRSTVSNLSGKHTDKLRVETSGDFDRLAAYYNSTNGPNSPAQSTQSQQTTQCPEEDANFFASTTLPPTPNEAVCNCINENAFGCRVRQASANQPVIVGELIK